MKVLIVYATSHGSTELIAHRIGEVMRGHGVDPTVQDARKLKSTFDVSPFQAIVVGGRVWGNKYPRALTRFVRRHGHALRTHPSAFFSVCLWIASRMEEHRKEALLVPHRFTVPLHWSPDRVGVFAGTLAFSRFGFLGKRLIRSIWKKDLGSLDIRRDHELTDWTLVDRFAEEFLAFARSRYPERLAA